MPPTSRKTEVRPHWHVQTRLMGGETPFLLVTQVDELRLGLVAFL